MFHDMVEYFVYVRKLVTYRPTECECARVDDLLCKSN